MSRSICVTCLRPERVCLCDWIKPIKNQVSIGILQHPTESKQIKGTAKIAELSLEHCQTWIGESLENLPGLVSWLQGAETVFLLYPALGDSEGTKTFSISELREQVSLETIKILILDGTWRKTHKMMQINPLLSQLVRLSIEPETPSNYKIRKQKNSMSLSTIEAIYSVLSQLEVNQERYQPLITAFEQMVQQQLAFRECQS